MSFQADDTAIVMRSVDGAPVAYQIGGVINKDGLAVVSQTMTGPAAMRAASMSELNDVGSAIRSVDGVPVAIADEGDSSPPPPPAGEMILVFTDEDSPTYHPDPATRWSNDVVRWETLQAGGGVQKYGAVSEVIGAFEPDILPPGESPPPEIPYRTINRNPTLAEMRMAYYFAKGSAGMPTPLKVMLFVDGSSSLTRAALEPGIDDFEDWLDTQSVAWEENVWFYERWLYRVCKYYGYD